jgi:hypothetical protein
MENMTIDDMKKMDQEFINAMTASKKENIPSLEEEKDKWKLRALLAEEKLKWVTYLAGEVVSFYPSWTIKTTYMMTEKINDLKSALEEKKN